MFKPETITSEELSLKKPTKFKNEQRTLIFAQRGVMVSHRHLMNDLHSLLPHSKKEGKIDKKIEFSSINDICNLKNCQNCLFFRKEGSDLYLYVSKTDMGPTIKFKVMNLYTLGELKLTGNCLKGSRPILHFDRNFETKPEFQTIKELFIQVFSTPKDHPKSKPFIDHILSFFILDGKVWVRNYQVVDHLKSKKKSEKTLVEIGPRFVLELVRILDGAFDGNVIYNNHDFLSQREKLRRKRKMVELETRLKKKQKKKHISQLAMNEKDFNHVESVYLQEDDHDDDDGDDHDNDNNNNQPQSSMPDDQYDEESVDFD